MLTQAWIIPATLGFSAAGVAIVLWLHRRAHAPRPEKRVKVDRNTIQLPCSVCHKQMVFHRRELVALSGVDKALAVRVRPGLRERKLAEYVCPYCEAAHCFAVERRQPEWVGANFAQPQAKGNHCFECRKTIRKPSWPPGQYDGNLQEIPNLLPDHGLECKYCKGVVCVECCESTTRGRTPDGSWLCPRCFRHPMDTVYHG